MANSLIEIEVKGLSSLIKKLQALGPQIEQRGLRAATAAGAVIVRNSARRLISIPGPPRSEPGTPPHVDLGNLKAAIISYRWKKEDLPHKVTYGVTVRDNKIVKFAKRRYGTSRGAKHAYRRVAGPKAYARFLEFGTSKMEARPFLGPAFFNNQRLVVTAMKAKLREALKRGLKEG